ncbi:CSP4 [Symbiodinium natans]|uniref:CSP4 protein n=1 Tax=Symbiodinium natans TaxID=878477 RepID=A0A812FZM7_9DINO|nr:CSP4 [Symbiodinium natans]
MALTGVVKKYDTAKGFGFIVPTGTSTDLFVLRTDVIGGTLQAGDKVNFDEGLNDRTGKPKAIRVTGGTGPAPGGKGDSGDGEKGPKGGGKGKRGDKGKGGSKQQLPGALNGGLIAGPVPGGCGCCGCPAPCGLMLGGGGCSLGGAGKAPMPGGCAGLPDGVKSGIVKFFHDEKGFGFIKQDDGGNDLFVHRNDVIDTLLNEGDQVQYSEAVDNRSGRMKAHQVTGGTGAPKPPQEKGKGGKGKKGSKRNVPSDPGLPNPMPTMPDVPSQDTSSLSQKMPGNLNALSDPAMFGCANPGILMGKGGFPGVSGACGCNPCSGCDAQKMGCACGGCGCGGLCGGCGCGGCGGCGGGCGGCPGCGSACGGCGGCGQCMAGCGSLQMSGNSCNAGGCGCGGCTSGNACNATCNAGGAGSCNMPSSCCGCGGCGGGCSGCCGGCGCNAGCCGCGGCCPNFNACGCSGGATAGLGACLAPNNFEEDFDASSMTMCRGAAFSGLSAASPTTPCSAGGCSTGPCGGVGPCGPNWEGNLQGKAAMAAFPGQDPQRNSACFAQLMNVANLSGVAPSGVANPNPSSGDRFPAGGAGSMAGSFMQGGGDNNMPGPCFSNNAGSGGTLNAAMYERLASATGGGGGSFEDYAVYGGQGSNNLAARAAGCFSNLAGPCSNHG